MLKSIYLAIVCAASCGTLCAAPIFEYTFNSTGNTSPSTGTDTTPVEFYNASNTAADLHSAAGLGVAGDIVGHQLFGIDRAFDNSASTAMGNAGTGGLARHAADNESIDTLSSFTLSGWFKTAEAAGINGFARLIFNRSGSPATGFHLIGGGSAGTLRPAVDGTELSPDVGGFNATQTWVFFAMTYDGTQTVDNAKFYRGYRSSAEAALFGHSEALTLIDTRSLAQGAVNDNNFRLQIGNQDARDRPFDGYLDNIRIDGAQTGAGGVLSANDLEARRLGDITPVPEPSTWLALAGLLGGGWYYRRKNA
jgi:hypothetical protein